MTECFANLSQGPTHILSSAAQPAKSIFLTNVAPFKTGRCEILYIGMTFIAKKHCHQRRVSFCFSYFAHQCAKYWNVTFKASKFLWTWLLLTRVLRQNSAILLFCSASCIYIFFVGAEIYLKTFSARTRSAWNDRDFRVFGVFAARLN